MYRLLIVLRAAVLAVTVAVAGCGSPETPPAATPSPAANPAAPPAPPPPATVEAYPEVPAPSGEWTNKIGDLERDLQNLSAGGRDAAKDFADDLDAMAESSEIKPRRATLDALGSELAAVLPKATGGETLRPRLAQLLYVATRRAPMADARVTQLEGDTAKLLMAHGVPDASAKRIAGHVTTIARDSRRPA